jgi:regulation of enolase protein 1 (concanavalin A-like superfamily)
LVRHLSFDTNGAGEVGFSAQSPAGESCTVKFSQIEYRAVKIKDPYAGK